MAIKFHVASAGRYFRIEGTAASPVLTVGPIDLTSPYSGVASFCLFSPDGGQTLWQGGSRPTNGLLKSSDGGLTWVDQVSHMPLGNGNEQVTSIARDPVSGVMCATYEEHSGFTGVAGGILKYNPGTEDWELKAGDASWANAGTTNMVVVNGVWYCGVQFGATRRGLYRSTDDGETWVVDSSWTYTNWQGNGPPQLAVDSGNNFCCVNAWLAATNWRAYERYGQFGAGPFTPTAVIPPDDWAFSPPNGVQSGRLMMIDEQDAFWLAIDRNSLTHIVRRDPTSGLWSIEHVFTASNGARAIAVVDSQHIWAANQGGFAHISIYDGTTWYNHNYNSIHAQLQSTAAVWGEQTDVSGPYLDNLNPEDAEYSVSQTANIVLEILDAGFGVDEASVVLKVNGSTAWTGDAQQAGFAVAKTPISGGFRYTINPDASLPLGTTTVDVYAEDGLSQVLDTSYSFSTLDGLNMLFGFSWGAEKVGVAEGEGLTQPQVTGATSVDANTIRVTFDSDMLFIEDPASVLVPGNWELKEQISLALLEVLWVTKVSETQVDLHTPNQRGTGYTVTAVGVKNAWYTAIDTANDDANFAGTAPSYPALSSATGEFHSFFGLDSGLQDEEQTAFAPDTNAPVVTNQSPAPSDTGVAVGTNIQFDLTDLDPGLDLTTVEIYIESTLSYRGDTDSFIGPYGGAGSTKSGISNGFQFLFNPTSDFPSWELVSVQVIADDLNGNHLDTTYTFRIEDVNAPTLVNESPTGSGVSQSANISFELHDDGSGVDSGTLTVVVEGDAAIVNGVFQPPWTGTIVANLFNGYDVTINAPGSGWPSYDIIDVEISVDDVAANHADLGWSFSVEDVLGPRIIPVAPVAGEPEISIAANIEIRFQDEHEVVLTSMKVYIDQGGGGFELAYEGGGSPDFKPGWDGPASGLSGTANNRLLVIDKAGSLPPNTLITVWVFAQDPDGNTERL